MVSERGCQTEGVRRRVSVIGVGRTDTPERGSGTDRLIGREGVSQTDTKTKRQSIRQTVRAT